MTENIFRASKSLVERVGKRVRWAHEFETGNLTAGYHFMVPDFSAAKVLLKQRTKTSMKKAGNMLSALHRFFEATHHNRFLIEVLALEAMHEDALGH